MAHAGEDSGGGRGARRAAALALALSFGTGCLSMWMPGSSFRGPLPPVTPAQQALSRELYRDVVALAGRIGERRIGRDEQLRATVAFLEAELRAGGYPEVQRQTYQAGGRDVSTLIVEVRGTGRAAEILGIDRKTLREKLRRDDVAGE